MSHCSACCSAFNPSDPQPLTKEVVDFLAPLERWKGGELERESCLSAAVLKTENALPASVSRMEASPVTLTSGLFHSASSLFEEGLFACSCVMRWQGLWSTCNSILTFLVQTPVWCYYHFYPISINLLQTSLWLICSPGGWWHFAVWLVETGCCKELVCHVAAAAGHTRAMAAQLLGITPSCWTVSSVSKYVDSI